jgi:hypothetical protein
MNPLAETRRRAPRWLGPRASFAMLDLLSHYSHAPPPFFSLPAGFMATASEAPPQVLEVDNSTLFVKALDALAPRLPADSRVHLLCTHPAFRDADALRVSFRRLDLSPSSGVDAPVTDKLLRGCAALAHGRLELLDLRGCLRIKRGAVKSVVAANLSTLREVFIHHAGIEAENEAHRFMPNLAFAHLATLLTGAPQRIALEAVAVEDSTAAVVALLRATTQPGAMRITRVCIDQSLLAIRGEAMMQATTMALLMRPGRGPRPQQVLEMPLRIGVRMDDNDNAGGASLHITGGNRLLDDGSAWAAMVQALVAHPTLCALTLRGNDVNLGTGGDGELPR